MTTETKPSPAMVDEKREELKKRVEQITCWHDDYTLTWNYDRQVGSNYKGSYTVIRHRKDATDQEIAEKLQTLHDALAHASGYVFGTGANCHGVSKTWYDAAEEHGFAGIEGMEWDTAISIRLISSWLSDKPEHACGQVLGAWAWIMATDGYCLFEEGTY